MLITLHQLELRPVRFNVEIPADEIEYDGRVKQTSPLKAEGVAELVNDTIGEIRISGKLSATAEAPCDRCLETATVPIDKEFDLSYFPAEQYEGGGEAEIPENVSEIAYYERSRLELNDVLREVVLLALPMQVVCSEACKGICPTCGQNRNLQDCNCHAEAVDDRWSKLKALRNEAISRE